jgi:hypothetical protein
VRVGGGGSRKWPSYAKRLFTMANPTVQRSFHENGTTIRLVTESSLATNSCIDHNELLR